MSLNFKIEIVAFGALYIFFFILSFSGIMGEDELLC
jgi:hypothetical protein